MALTFNSARTSIAIIFGHRSFSSSQRSVLLVPAPFEHLVHVCQSQFRSGLESASKPLINLRVSLLRDALGLHFSLSVFVIALPSSIGSTGEAFATDGPDTRTSEFQRFPSYMNFLLLFLTQDSVCVAIHRTSCGLSTTIQVKDARGTGAMRKAVICHRQLSSTSPHLSTFYRLDRRESQ